MCNLFSILISLCPRVGRTFWTSRRLFVQRYLTQAHGRSNYEGMAFWSKQRTNSSDGVESFPIWVCTNVCNIRDGEVLDTGIIYYSVIVIFNLFFRWYFWLAHFRAEDSFSKLLDISSRIFKKAKQQLFYDTFSTMPDWQLRIFSRRLHCLREIRHNQWAIFW